MSDSPETYAALLPAGEAALQETVELARSLGTTVPSQSSVWDQLLALGRIWESDFAWMVPGADEVWTLAGGVVCFPSAWSLREKLGQPMNVVHYPVPKLNVELGRQIDAFLTRMEPGQAWTRENAGLSRDNERNHHTSRPRMRLDQSVTREEVFIRIEHQLLHKLPKCLAILFGIRVEVVPLATLLQDTEATSRLRRLLSTISLDAASYKGIVDAREAILKLLP